MRPLSERGTVTTMFAILAVFFFLMIGMIFEGGRKLENISRAEDLASEAARAAAATLDVEAIAEGRAEIDEVEALLQAEAIVAASGADAEIVEWNPSDESVQLAVIVRGDSWLPDFSLNGVGSHTAQVIDPEDFAP